MEDCWRLWEKIDASGFGTNAVKKAQRRLNFHLPLRPFIGVRIIRELRRLRKRWLESFVSIAKKWYDSLVT
jgi:hypothetical protein